jgi:hypothetical protein
MALAILPESSSAFLPKGCLVAVASHLMQCPKCGEKRLAFILGAGSSAMCIACACTEDKDNGIQQRR